MSGELLRLFGTAVAETAAAGTAAAGAAAGDAGKSEGRRQYLHHRRHSCQDYRYQG